MQNSVGNAEKARDKAQKNEREERREREAMRDEIERLKTSIVNKDSQT